MEDEAGRGELLMDLSGTELIHIHREELEDNGG